MYVLDMLFIVTQSTILFLGDPAAGVAFNCLQVICMINSHENLENHVIRDESAWVVVETWS